MYVSMYVRMYMYSNVYICMYVCMLYTLQLSYVFIYCMYTYITLTLMDILYVFTVYTYVRIKYVLMYGRASISSSNLGCFFWLSEIPSQQMPASIWETRVQSGAAAASPLLGLQ
jgi:hypothetical protein